LFGGYGLALAALALVFFGAQDSHLLALSNAPLSIDNNLSPVLNSDHIKCFEKYSNEFLKHLE